MKDLAGLFLSLVMVTGVSAAPIKVACIGDSITYGTGINHRNLHSYPAQLQKLLGADYEVRNFGDPGRGVYLHSMRGKMKRGFRFMKQHRDALAWQPDWVICNLGINDCGEFLTKEHIAPGTFRSDYIKLLRDYLSLPSKPKLLVWGKLAPLAPGQTFYRSPEPFLMQRAIADAADVTGARLIDMQEPLRPLFLTEFPDRIHPNPKGAAAIAKATYDAMLASETKRIELPEGLTGKAEVWLCAGQSNMDWKLRQCPDASSEAKATARHLIYAWEFRSARWEKVTAKNAGKFSAIAVSFATRRAEKTGKPIALLIAAHGGAPTEAFLSERTMAAIDSNGQPLYPHLLQIVTDRRDIGTNEAFPCLWCKREYPRRLKAGTSSRLWGTSTIYDQAIAKLRHLPIDGVIWYQGESNATTNIKPDVPLDETYMEETLLAIVQELRFRPDIPFLMMGLPKINRPWAPYRKLQQKVCAATGALYIDSFNAGLGDLNDVHPKHKVPFVELLMQALEK